MVNISLFFLFSLLLSAGSARGRALSTFDTTGQPGQQSIFLGAGGTATDGPAEPPTIPAEGAADPAEDGGPHHDHDEWQHFQDEVFAGLRQELFEKFTTHDPKKAGLHARVRDLYKRGGGWCLEQEKAFVRGLGRSSEDGGLLYRMGVLPHFHRELSWPSTTVEAGVPRTPSNQVKYKEGLGKDSLQDLPKYVKSLKDRVWGGGASNPQGEPRRLKDGPVRLQLREELRRFPGVAKVLAAPSEKSEDDSDLRDFVFDHVVLPLVLYQYENPFLQFFLRKAGQLRKLREEGRNLFASEARPWYLSSWSCCFVWIWSGSCSIAPGADHYSQSPKPSPGSGSEAPGPKLLPVSEAPGPLPLNERLAVRDFLVLVQRALLLARHTPTLYDSVFRTKLSSAEFGKMSPNWSEFLNQTAQLSPRAGEAQESSPKRIIQRGIIVPQEAVAHLFSEKPFTPVKMESWALTTTGVDSVLEHFAHKTFGVSEYKNRVNRLYVPNGVAVLLESNFEEQANLRKYALPLHALAVRTAEWKEAECTMFFGMQYFYREIEDDRGRELGGVPKLGGVPLVRVVHVDAKPLPQLETLTTELESLVEEHGPLAMGA